MLLPKKMPARVAPIVYMTVSAIHGLLFDVFYVPAYLLFANIPLDRLHLTLLLGLPYVALQAVGNFALGTLIVPIATLLRKLDKKT